MGDDLVLRLQQIGALGVELFGPKMSAAVGVDELGVDPHLIAARLNRAFQHIAHAQILADRLGVDRLALVGEGRIARDDEAVADARESGGQFIGERVGEVVLRRIAGEIGEGQHDDGKTRGLGGRVRGDVAGRFALRKYQAPPAIRTSSAASAAASGASPKRLFCGVGAAGVTGSAAFVGFACAGTPTCSE